jgi:Peptidase family S41
VTTRTPSAALGLTIVGLALLLSPMRADSADFTIPLDPLEESRIKAGDLEKRGRWEEAVQQWYRVLTLNRNDPEAKERLRKCVRMAVQSRRTQDPDFAANVLSLPTADVIALYAEAVKKIQSVYVDAEKVTASRLFRQGLDEFLASLGDKAFVARHLPEVSESRIRDFRSNLLRAWGDRDVVTLKESAEIVAEIATAAKRNLGFKTINPVMFEFLCGACNSLDEYSAYLPDSGREPASRESEAGSILKPASVEIELRDGNVGYLRINHFQPTTPQEVEEAIKTLVRMGNVRSVILDLRGNPGGHLLSAIKTAEKFLPNGLIVSSQGQSDEFNKIYSSTSGPVATDLPVVVMINGETASAAEVLAVALRDNRRGKLIGMPSFGKGTVQKIIHFTTAEETDPATGRKKPRASMRITLARLFSPNGLPLAGNGVAPEIVESDPERQNALAMDSARESARRYSPMMTIRQ